MKIKISADSTCDLSPELVERYDIGIVPLCVMRDGVPYKDGIEMRPRDIFNHVSAGGDLCTTAAVNVADYVDYFTECRRNYDAVIHFHISGEMSACYQNALIAAKEVGGIYPIDSRNLSTGIGHLVLDSAILAREGKEPHEICDIINAKKEKLEVSFVLDTLEYLRKGGRCSSVAALGANLLSLHPCIEVKDGKMGVGKKYRGTIEKCIAKYIEDRLKDRDDVDYSRIFITRSYGFSQEALDSMKKLVAELGPFEEILETEAGCTISSHCGPKCLGILFYRK